jgi:Zn-finger nucleic acid-binding protein
MANSQGVEVDYCPKCHGIWLDRGELDKLVHQSITNHTNHKKSYGLDGGLQKHTKSGVFHSSSHHERGFKHGKLKSLLR